MKILVINGPNLNMLGIREPEIYGRRSYDDLCGMIKEKAEAEGFDVAFYQSNHEGAIVDEIQASLGRYDGIVINPGAYTHYSIAILDALKAVGLPAVEVHISDVDARESFRSISVTAQGCVSKIAGKGFEGYLEAIDILKAYV